MTDAPFTATGTPERAHTLIAKIGADTRRDMVRELLFLADRIERNELSKGCSGGPSGGAIYSYHTNPAQTHDAYFAQIEVWLEREKAKTTGGEHD